MPQFAAVRRPAVAALMAGVATIACGCLSPQNVRVPSLYPRGTEYERAESRVHDPFNATDIGPDTFNRPPGFTNPRPEAVRVREQTGLSGLRQQFGRPTPPVLPLGMQPSYGSAVR